MHTRTGYLLVNLGTPDSPDPSDVKTYLTEFLTDPRVIEIPWIMRQLLVRGYIIPRRYRESAKGYKAIWSDLGSPLMVHGRDLQKSVQHALGPDFVVELAMRYRNPSIASGLKALIAAEVSEIIILPLFPQYASATTGSVQQCVMDEIRNWRDIPKLTFIDHFYDREDLIDAFSSLVDGEILDAHDEILFSFHGLPKKSLSTSNPQCFKCESCCASIRAQNRMCYSAQSFHMASAIASKLGIPKERYNVSFQSRLGKEPWLQPYTSDAIIDAARRGKKNLLLYSPSFVCDCLETLYEIEVEYAHEFIQAGGEKLTLVPGLNTHPKWIETVASIAREKCSSLR